MGAAAELVIETKIYAVEWFAQIVHRLDLRALHPFNLNKKIGVIQMGFRSQVVSIM